MCDFTQPFAPSSIISMCILTCSRHVLTDHRRGCHSVSQSQKPLGATIHMSLRTLSRACVSHPLLVPMVVLQAPIRSILDLSSICGRIQPTLRFPTPTHAARGDVSRNRPVLVDQFCNALEG